ncbi:MAG: hypothetical protein RJA44_1522, partial [Pseudomonadota bacterium]
MILHSLQQDSDPDLTQDKSAGRGSEKVTIRAHRQLHNKNGPTDVIPGSSFGLMLRFPTRHWPGAHGLLGVLVLFALVLTGLDLNSSYQHVRSLAKKDLGNLTQVLENQLDADFNAAARVVGTMASQIDPKALQQSQVPHHRAEVSQWLDAQLETVGTASALRVFDAEGNRLYSTTRNEPP